LFDFVTKHACDRWTDRQPELLLPRPRVMRHAVKITEEIAIVNDSTNEHG